MKRTALKESLLHSLIRFTLSSKESFVITIEVVIGIALCVFSLASFLYFTEGMLEADFNQFDTTVAEAVYQLRNPTLTYLMTDITTLGSATQVVIMSLVGIIFLLKKHKKESIVFSLALMMGILINGALKLLIQRPRPHLDPLIAERMSSFPSGHTMNAFIFFSLLSYFSYHFFKKKKWTLLITTFSVICIFLVGFSRIYLGVHHPSDVLAGFIAGFWWFITVLLIDKTMIFYKLFKKSE